MDKVILIAILFSFLIGCGDDDNRPPKPQPPPAPECNYTYSECKEGNVRTVLSVSPSGCVGEPDLTCTYVPPVTDCCPDQENVLRCGSCLPDKPCLTENPDIWLYCTGDMYAQPYWHLRLGWGVVFVDVSPPDTSCCPWQKTGICYEECNRLTPCNALYANQPTEWYVMGDYAGYWYVYSDRTYRSYRIYVNE